MKPTSREILQSISNECHNQLTYYTFNTTTLQVTAKYREGRLAGLRYLSELTWYYLQEEKRIIQQFDAQIIKQLEQYASLEENDYKQGLFSTLKEIHQRVQDMQKKN